MSSQTATNLERLEKDVRFGQHQRSSPGVVQRPFAEAAEQDVLKAIETLIAEVHQIQEPEGNNVWVVHYTDIPSTISVLTGTIADARNENQDQSRNSYLRMYSTVGSNDPGEGSYLHRFLTNGVLRRTIHENATRPETQYEVRQYAYVASFIRPNDPSQTHQAADNLVFWRSYGREGTGCSLTVQLPQKELRTVTYGENDTQNTGQRLTQEIGRLWEVAVRIRDIAGVSLEPLIEAIDFAMEKVRYLYKSDAYRYEQECRVVETPATIRDTNMKPLFEHSGPQGRERTKRYINNPLLAVNKLLVSDSIITLGPRVSNAMDTKEYIEHLLKEASLLGPKVQCSNIEYRSSTNH